MISAAYNQFFAFASLGAVPADLTSVRQLLSTTDRVLSIVASLLLIGTGVWWVARSRRDPLSNAPLRPNQIREDALALAVLVYLTTAFLAATVIRLGTGQSESVLAQLIVGNSAQLAGIGICLFIAATRFQGGVVCFWLGVGHRRLRRRVGLVAVLSVAALGLCPVVRDITALVILWFAPGYEFSPHATVKALHDPTQPAGVIAVLWLAAVVVAPVAEELFFRGLLQTFLATVVRNRWYAIVLSSIVFGAVHFQQPSATPALAVLGLLMGYAYERTGSLIPPIAIHAVFNLKTLVWDALSGAAT